MATISLETLVAEQLAAAREAGSGRSASTIHGGRRRALQQTVLALAAGHGLAEHENPGEATLQVLHGRVRLDTGTESHTASAGEYLEIPGERHGLAALTDSAVLLTIVASRST